MLEQPYPYQVTGATWLAPRTHAILADDMGLGKSAQAILAADEVGARHILVLCPAAVRVNWEREFEKFSPMDRPCQILWTGNATPAARGVVIASYEWATTNAHLLKAQRWDLLVLDEAQYLKERSAKRTKAVYGRSRTLPGIVAACARVWRLTGTPASNNAAELYTHLKSAGVYLANYWDFVAEFCTGYEGSFGFTITGVKNPDRLRALMAPVLLRRTKAEVQMDLPPIRFQQVAVQGAEVKMDQSTRAQIKVGEQTLQSALQAIGGNVEKLNALAQDQAIATLRRYTALAKLPAILELVKADLDAGLDKLVLFAIHQQVVEEAVAALAPYGAVAVYGKTDPSKRQGLIDRFASDKNCRVLIGNIQAAGVGVNGMQTSCSTVGMLEQSWVPSDNAQAYSRVHRNGQKNSVLVRVYSLHGSVDEQVQATLIRKARELTKIF